MHFSDVHFGVENYGRFDPATGVSTRLIDFRESLSAACREAVTRDVEVGIFTGDAYKSRDPNQTHQREFASCLSLLTSHGIPVVLLAGNHDVPNMKGRANAIEIFSALAGDLIYVIDQPRVIRLSGPSGREIQIAGLPYLTKSSQLVKSTSDDRGVADTTAAVEDRYQKAIQLLADQCAQQPALPTVFMGHFTVTTAKIGPTQAGYLTNEPAVPRGALTTDAFDYVALGHIHKHQDLNKGAQPPIVYAGSIERIDFGERSDAKGVVFADVSRGETKYEFFEVPTRSFIEIDVDTTSGVDDPTDRIIEAINRHRLDNAIVKLSYKVRSEDAVLLREKEIRAALQDAFMVLSINRQIARDETEIRSRALGEALDPLKALEIYLDSRDTLKGRKEELVRYADALLKEVEGAASQTG